MTQDTLHLESYLEHYFNYDHFQTGQKEIMTDVLAGNDVLGVLPTGSGKSLCYQLPAKILPGLTIVVSPLISLMIDQVRQMKAFYYKEVAALHSFHNWREKKRILQQMNRYKLIFVSPELLQQAEIMRLFKRQEISLFVIDEAHCISQWGYDFRPDYLRLRSIINELGDIPVLALTGTASPTVQTDMIEKIGKPEMKRHIYSMERTNISFIVEEIAGSEKDKKNSLVSYLKQVTAPTIIYFSSRKLAEQIASYLMDVIPGRNIAFYHAGMETLDRLKVQQQFMNDQLDIICCTSAFGMGINKPNIRLIIHYHLPTQIESFVQEVGRAGRDGKDSVSVVLYKKEENQIPIAIIENELPLNTEIHYVFHQLYKIVQNQSCLPSTREQCEQVFQINEVKWRVLHFQMEMHGIIKNKQIYYDQQQWEKAKEAITTFCATRLEDKRKKLYKMIHWAEGKDCLRQSLYYSLQDKVIEHKSNCCSNCGFSIGEWEYQVVEKKKLEPSSGWQNQLQALLLIGEPTNETSRND